MRLVLLFLLSISSLFARGAEDITKVAVAIVGGGASGLSCAASCASMGFTPVVFDVKDPSIEDEDTHPMTNWPGVKSTTWRRVREDLRKDVVAKGGIVLDAEVTSIKPSKGVFVVTSDNGIFHALSLVMATGKAWKKIDGFVPEKETKDRLVRYFFDEGSISSEDTVLLAGQGRDVLMDALLASLHAKHVTVLTLGRLQGDLLSLAKRSNRISFTHADRITGFRGKKDQAFVEFKIKNAKLSEEASWFVYDEESPPASELVKNFVSCDSSSAIIVNRETLESSLRGLFACGEVAKKGRMLAISSSAEGAEVSRSVLLFLLDIGWTDEMAERYKKPLLQKFSTNTR